MSTQVPGPGWRLLAPGTKLKKGDQYFSGGVIHKWKNTVEVGRIARANLIYRRRAFGKSAASSKFDLGEKLAARAHERAKALQMSTSAYVKQCVEGELTKSQRSTVTSRKDTPAMNVAKQDYGCGEGYRWVGPNEVLMEGDERKVGLGWSKTKGVGCIVERSRYYRRKV